MATTIKSSELDFDTIKTKLKNHFKSQSVFKDYDFEDYDSEEEEVSKTIRCIINFIEEEPESISI